MREVIPAFRDKNNPLVNRIRNGIDRLLQSLRIIGDSIALCTEAIA
jgi:hypothetical protein